MRAEIRRIDLTTEPAIIEAWPSLDWLSAVPEAPACSGGPRGRGGLWEAMAQAVQRAREASILTDQPRLDAEIIALPADAPHLAYLARVAAGARAADGEATPADVIALRDLRPRDRH